MENKPQMLMLDGTDEILKHWQHGTNALVIDRKEISSKVMKSPWPIHIPVSFRSMTKRKEIYKCWETGRPFYYVDNGYMGNLMKKKIWYRIVKNNVQHTQIREAMPADRYHDMCRHAPYLTYSGFKEPRGDRLKNGPILLVTPSEKPCNFYNIKREEWVANTIKELKKHTHREIIIRHKDGVKRSERIKDNSVAAQCFRDDIWALVTYQSMAALEAMHYGIPAFTMAPNCVQSVANTDLSRIEDPVYPTREKFLNVLYYIAYCQYNLEEMRTGLAYRMIEEHKLYDTVKS